MEFRVLGPLEVVGDGEPIPLGGPKERLVLAALLRHANEIVPSDRLLEEIWSGEPPASGRASLQAHVSRVRKRLREGGDAEERIVNRAGGYVVTVDDDEFDVARFEQLSRAGSAAMSAGDVAGASTLFAEALDLWRGEAFADLPLSAPMAAFASQLDDRRLGMLEDRIEADLTLGRHAEVVPELEVLVAEHPLRERLSGQLMTALYRAGRQAEALAVYERLRRFLLEQLGIDPVPALRNLHVAILQQRPHLRAGSLVAPEPPTNLPEPRSSFVGRSDDIARLAELLDAKRLVTLVGVGGAGKTRLAVEVARHARAGHPDGVFFVDLASVTDASGVHLATAEALGIAKAHGAPIGADPEAAVAGFLRRRRVLLLLDNCEHVRVECAALVDRILAAPGPTVLATSREVLGIDGEQWWPVDPLSLPERDAGAGRDDADALRLLTERIGAVRPGFEPGATDRDALVDICHRLDGIPLALELAAARAALLTPREIADRLDQRFALLTSGRQERVRRHRTLEATLGWSFDLLHDDERRVFRRLAVFPGPFTIEAVEGVCLADVDVPAIDAVGSLVERSLVVHVESGDRTRYRLLETVRAFAHAKLVEAGEDEAVRSRHRDRLLEVRERRPWDQCLLGEAAVDRAHREAHDFRAALEWSQAQGRPDLIRRLVLHLPVPLYASGHFADADRWLDHALAYEETLPRDQWACHVLGAWVGQAQWRGGREEVAASIARLEDLLPHLPEGGAVRALAHAVLSVRLTVFPERADEMERHCDLAVEHAAPSSPLIASWARWFKAIAFLLQYRYDEAKALVGELHRSAEPSTAVAVGTVDALVALVWHLEGRDREVLDLFADPPDAATVWAGSRYVMTAVATAALGDLPRARAHMQAAVADLLGGDWSAPLAHFDCLIGLAVLAAIEGNHDRTALLTAPITAMTTPPLGILLRHYRDRLRDHLDPETRRRLIDEGRSRTVEDAIQGELARWNAEGFEAAANKTKGPDELPPTSGAVGVEETSWR